MTFAEKAALEQAYADITALKARVADLEQVNVSLLQRITALESKPSTLTLNRR